MLSTHRSALFCIRCMFICWCRLFVTSGMGGYSSIGRISVLYSCSFVCVVHEEKRLRRAKANLAFLARSLACIDVPCVFMCTPSIVPVYVYGMSVLLIVISGGFRRAAGMMWNLFMFVRIFHCVS